jgi:hypothetical protein
MLEGRGDRVPGARSDLCVCLDCCFAVFAGLCGERVLVYKYCETVVKLEHILLCTQYCTGQRQKSSK